MVLGGGACLLMGGGCVGRSSVFAGLLVLVPGTWNWYQECDHNGRLNTYAYSPWTFVSTCRHHDQSVPGTNGLQAYAV